MAVEPSRRVGRRRPGAGPSDQVLTLLVAALVVALLSTVVLGWLTLRSPGLAPVSIPSVSQG